MNETMSHNACTVNCPGYVSVPIWLHSREVDGKVFFHYSVSLAGTTFYSFDFKSICLCYSSIRDFVSRFRGTFQLDDGYDSVTDYLNDLWSDVVFQKEVSR